MDLVDALRQISARAEQAQHLLTEEATKMALVVPFVAALGYDVYDPLEVVPEYVADVGIKKGEKVDYAIIIDGKPAILIECKKAGDKLGDKPESQLYRYFSVTPARVAILTDGILYRFFSDIESDNIMDEKPFLEVDIREVDGTALDDLRRFTKARFDLQQLLPAAEDLKYSRAMKQVLISETREPSDEFVRFLAGRVYQGRLGKNVVEKFTRIVKIAFNEFINERIERRLKAALDQDDAVDVALEAPTQRDQVVGRVEPEPLPSGVVRIDGDIVTTKEEQDAYYVIKAIARGLVDVSRVTMRDAKSYCSIILDDNNRKPVCRLWFNGKRTRYLGLFGPDKTETKVQIEAVDDIYRYADELLATIGGYVQPHAEGSVHERQPRDHAQ